MGKCVSKQTSILTLAEATTITTTATTTTIQQFNSQNSLYIPIITEKDKTLAYHHHHSPTKATTVTKEENKCNNCEENNIFSVSNYNSNNSKNNNKNNNTNTNKNNKRNKKKRNKTENNCTINNEGQSESKKSSKRGGPETKGTAMSFGFRKKLHTPKKKNNLLQKENKDKEKDTTIDTVDYHNQDKYNHHQSATVISNPGILKTEDLNSDKNGNSGPENNEKNEIIRNQQQSRQQLIRRDLGCNTFGAGSSTITTTNIATGGTIGYNNRTSRFGFRSTNIVRPASTGITPKITDFEENMENNNVSDKRRSKSAHTGRTLTSYRSNDQQLNYELKNTTNPKIGSIQANNSINNQMKQQQQYQQHQEHQHHHYQQQQQQFNIMRTPPNHQHQSNTTNDYAIKKQQSGQQQCTIINSGMHTNVIMKPTPQTAVSVSKFTLHTASLPKPQYPVPISLTTHTTRTIMDTKNVKQALNNTRKGFFGPRDISADSGISSLENTTYDNGAGNNSSMACGGGSPSRKLNRGRPRNLEMVMSGRHKFEVRDLDDTLSCDSIEPLALPKLPSVFSSNNQTVPLSGLVRSNTVLNRESMIAAAAAAGTAQNSNDSNRNPQMNRTPSDAGSIEEEKLNRDQSTSEKSTKNPSLKDYNVPSSKNSSPGSSRASWCNAGESLAIKDCSSLSLSSSDESKDQQNEKTANITDENILTNSLTISENLNLTSTGTVPKSIEKQKYEKSKENYATAASGTPSLTHQMTETKFAEMAASVDILLDDETSPTDSLVSSTESDDHLNICKKSKKKSNEEIQEKDIDEISPEIDEICSPISPGTPTHASNSLSLSDVGRDFLIDDEIADQPALLFSDNADNIEATPPRHSLTDTPTLKDPESIKSPALSSRKSIMHAAIELSLRTPISLRKAALLHRTESLDTLSPCESIASDDLMMDYDCHSSLDSIDRMSHSIRSHNGSALQGLDDTQMFSELGTKGAEMIKEWNNILKLPKTPKDNNNRITPQLPVRTTRLLNRSRLQPNQLSYAGSDSPKSGDSLPRKSSRPSSHLSSFRDPNSSSDDLMIHDKSFRNSMIQDVLYFKKQLLRLRRVLQEQDEENLKRTDTLNPFDLNNGQFFASCGGLLLDSNNQSSADEKDLGSLTSSSCLDDPLQELSDLRRQVVFLQGQVEDRDRTIRIQKNLIDKFESERSNSVSISTSLSEKECINTATQTERVRPLSMGPDGLARSKQSECTSYTTHFPAIINSNKTPSPTIQTSRRHTVISTTFTNLNHTTTPKTTRRSSIGWENLTYKPVKTTLIGDPIKDFQNSFSPLSLKTTKQNISISSPSVKLSSNESIVNNNNNHKNCEIIIKNGNNQVKKQLNKQFDNHHNQQQHQQQHQQQQQQQFITEPSRCHQKRKSINFDDIHSDHHSHTVTIV